MKGRSYYKKINLSKYIKKHSNGHYQISTDIASFVGDILYTGIRINNSNFASDAVMAKV